MAEFLSVEWLADLDELALAAADLADAAETKLVIEQQVLRADGDTTVYHLVLGPGPARVEPGPADHADLTLVATEVAARGIHDGATNAQSCLADGTLRLRGNPDVLTRHASVLERIGDVFADAASVASARMSTSTITEQDFRAEATGFLDAHASRRGEAKEFVWGEGSDNVSILEEKSAEQEAAELRAAKEWKATEFDAGFGWITGPEEYGGRALPASHDRAYRELASHYALTPTGQFGIGLGMVAPTILAHAIPEVKEQYLRSLYRGEIVACQLFSEPVAGSDLAGIQTRAERDGDEWIVSGQKVWTSGAQFSDIGEIITRTNPDKPKHQGLTMFVVDMHAPGIEIRPLRQMTGGASFNEVFFDDVRIPDSHRLGDVDGGWSVALTTLMNERAAIGGGGAGVGTVSFTRFAAMAKHYGLTDDPLIRQALADVYVRQQVHRLTSLRGMARIRAGQLPGPEMSIGKLSLTTNMTRIGDLLTSVLGPRLVADGGEWGTYAWAEFVLGVPGMRVAGGTDEIMRNIVGERVLGLPKDPSPKEPARSAE